MTSTNPPICETNIVRTYVCTYVHTYVYVCACVNTYVCTHSLTHTRARTHTHARTSAHARTHNLTVKSLSMKENSTETSEKLDDVPSFPSRNADKGPGNVFLPTENDSKYETVRFDGGAIYGHRLDQRIPPPGHNPVRGPIGRGEQRGGYLQRGSYDGSPQVPLHHDHLSYGHGTHAGNLQQPHLGMLDRNRSNQRSYQDGIYANVYERQAEDGRHQATQESGLGRYLSGGSAGDAHRPAGGRDTEANSVAAFTSTYSQYSPLRIIYDIEHVVFPVTEHRYPKSMPLS